MTGWMTWGQQLAYAVCSSATAIGQEAEGPNLALALVPWTNKPRHCVGCECVLVIVVVVVVVYVAVVVVVSVVAVVVEAVELW